MGPTPIARSVPKEIYKQFISPVLDRLDSEAMHTRAIDALHIAEKSSTGLKVIEFASYRHERYQDEKLAVELGGVVFENPLVVGAGWDKAGRAVKGLYTLGFSGVEVGTVTKDQQQGNAKPRQWMIADGVALNRMGFNSPGMEATRHNIQASMDSGIPIGINVGKNKDGALKDTPDAYASVVKTFVDHAAYFAVNVSSPNTPGLRSLQDKAPLTDIVQAVKENSGKKPIMVKIAPELTITALDDVIDVVRENGATGIIAANTTTDSGLKAKYGEQWRTEEGGLSGDDWQYRMRVGKIISHIYGQTNGEMQIIASGGAKDHGTTIQYLKQGATIVQFVTAIRGEGPSLPGKINRKLSQYLGVRGFATINDVIGMEVKK